MEWSTSQSQAHMYLKSIGRQLLIALGVPANCIYEEYHFEEEHVRVDLMGVIYNWYGRPDEFRIFVECGSVSKKKLERLRKKYLVLHLSYDLLEPLKYQRLQENVSQQLHKDVILMIRHYQRAKGMVCRAENAVKRLEIMGNDLKKQA